MRHLVEAGTDAALLLLFDPGEIPEDFGPRIVKNAIEFLDELTKEGKAFCIDTGADGSYLLHAYAEESVPATLQEYLRDPLHKEAFAVPTGRLFFTGAEYLFREDDTFLRKHPHMGGYFVIPSGLYRLTLWRTEYPEELRQKLLREQVSPWSFALHQGMGWFVMIAALGILGLSITSCLTPLSVQFWWLLPVWVLMTLLPIFVARLQPYREARDRFREIERNFPSVVAQLELRDDSLTLASTARQVIPRFPESSSAGLS